MCGRFAQSIPLGKLNKIFSFDEIIGDYRTSYNIAPGNEASVIILDKNKLILTNKKWGLVPPWSRDEKTAYKMINARFETIETKKSFQNGFRSRRCLIPVTGFYEWKKENGIKQPYFIHLKKDNDKFHPMLLGGIHEIWKRDDRLLETFLIITVDSTGIAGEIHDRMPLIISNSEIGSWLNEGSAIDTIKKFSNIGSEADIEVYPVSKFVNSVYNNGKNCIERLDENDQQLLL